MRCFTGTAGLALFSLEVRLQSLKWAAALVFVTVGTSACVGERDFPRPAEMCENLVQVCGEPVLLDHESDVFRDCYDVGRAGVKDPKNEAQCFAVYDECFNDCEFWHYYYTFDAGADAAADAATSLDAQSDANEG